MKNKARLTTLSVVSLKNLKPSKKVSSAIDYIKDAIPWQLNQSRRKRNKDSSGSPKNPSKSSQERSASKSISHPRESHTLVGEDNLPIIKTADRHLRHITADSLQAIKKANKPEFLFVRSGSIVRLKPDEKERISIELVNQDILRNILERSANFVVDEDLPIPPPIHVVKDVLAIGRWELPRLEGVLDVPVMRPDGSILYESGYDQITGLFLQPDPKLNIKPVQENPTSEQMKDALRILDELIHDFPFVDGVSKANALGLLITPLLRPAISGNVPLALVDAPQPGTGKTLLCKAISLISVGNVDTLTTAPNNSEEWRKKITSVLRRGSLIIIIDNIDGRLVSDDLAAALTTDTWSDRLLGHNKIISLPQRSIWIGNGNNITVGGDLPRRSYMINLDAKSSRPWQRDDFQHSDFEEWVAANRGDFVWSILTLARDWVVSGRQPFSDVSLGGFSDWAKTVGGILTNAGIAGFLGNTEEMYEFSSEEDMEWESFLLALHERYCGREVPIREISNDLENEPSLANLIPITIDNPFNQSGVLKPDFSRQLGQEFGRKVGTRYGLSNVHIERANYDSHNKVATWRFVRGDCGYCGDDLP